MAIAKLPDSNTESKYRDGGYSLLENSEFTGRWYGLIIPLTGMIVLFGLWSY